MLRFFVFIAACTLTASLHAQSVYKCKVDGKTSYSDRPCAQGASQALPPPAAGISLGDQIGPQGGDARTLLELEKSRMAREKAQEKEARAQVRDARAMQAQRKKCAKLRMQHKWAEEDQAHTVHGPKYEAARIKLRRQAEALAVECPA
jgi:hypothetical protein